MVICSQKAEQTEKLCEIIYTFLYNLKKKIATIGSHALLVKGLISLWMF